MLGVRVELLEHLKNMINAGIAPYIPNAVIGASETSLHLAHLALAVIGEGKVFYKKSSGTPLRYLPNAGLGPSGSVTRNCLMNGPLQ